MWAKPLLNFYPPLLQVPTLTQERERKQKTHRVVAGNGQVDTSLVQHCCPLSNIHSELQKSLGDGIRHHEEIRTVGLLQHGTGVVKSGMSLGIGEVIPAALLGGDVGWPDSVLVIVSLHHSLRDIEQPAHISLEVIKGPAEAGDRGPPVGEVCQQEDGTPATCASHPGCSCRTGVGGHRC